MVIKCGYDVLYKAYDGIHMRPVMTYTVRVMSSTERVEEMADLTGFKSDIELG